MLVCVCVKLLVKVAEALLPVWRPGNVPALIQQFDAVEVQHEGVGHQESALGFPSALEFLTREGRRQKDERDQACCR